VAAVCNREGHIYFQPVVCSSSSLWSPYGIGHTIKFLPCGFFYRRLDVCHTSTHCVALVRISDADLKHAANTGSKKVAKDCHLRTIAQLCWAISSQLRHIPTIRKKRVKQHYLLQMSPQYGELRHTIGRDRLTSLGYPCKFQRLSRLGSVTARHVVVCVSQTLRRWTEGATYIR